jgi:hypothetical protein
MRSRRSFAGSSSVDDAFPGAEPGADAIGPPVGVCFADGECAGVEGVTLPACRGGADYDGVLVDAVAAWAGHDVW